MTKSGLNLSLHEMVWRKGSPCTQKCQCTGWPYGVGQGLAVVWVPGQKWVPSFSSPGCLPLDAQYIRPINDDCSSGVIHCYRAVLDKPMW